MIFYQVVYDGPFGPSTIGNFKTKKDAEKCKIKWDKENNHPFDKAVVIKAKLK